MGLFMSTMRTHNLILAWTFNWIFQLEGILFLEENASLAFWASSMDPLFGDFRVIYPIGSFTARALSFHYDSPCFSLFCPLAQDVL